ncbi:hypothetical protein B0T18DRAFT_87540 [Schizothecium vesticola]|uniref:Uncharacterized protein n=1 Tax=Schizothecium vesticola TaxID=314040 RepID=A0AA40F6W9_9PEZI|nr:hypothetical protein B0T18DRAFT_87540 [Schizothecium vesticola]
MAPKLPLIVWHAATLLAEPYPGQWSLPKDEFRVVKWQRNLPLQPAVRASGQRWWCDSSVLFTKVRVSLSASQLRSMAFPNMATKDKREMDPARQSVPTVPPWAETSKHCASSCTAIAFLLVASDGHRNGRFSTQNSPRPPDRKSLDFATGTPIKGSNTPKSLPATLYMQR